MLGTSCTRRRCVHATLALTLSMTTVGHAAVIHVDDDADPGGDGESWPTAFRHLHDALAVAQPGDEIRVAQGTYVPDPEEGDRLTSFVLVDGSVLRGGFAGLGAPDPDARDIAMYVTILSGDLAGDDGPDFANNDENSLHVVDASDVGPTTELSGVTITAGNANGPEFPETDAIGAGVLNFGGSPRIDRCRFDRNFARQAGAGLANLIGAGPTVTDCAFVGNVVEGVAQTVGGGMVDVFETTTVAIRCVFRDNRSDFGGGGYGGQGATPRFDDCVFENNVARSGGGVMTLDTALRVDRCVFRANVGLQFAGGALAMINEGGPDPLVTSTLFIGNQARDGGAVAVSGGAPELVNCTFVRNRADEKAGGEGGAMFSGDTARAVVRNSILWGNNPEEVVDLPSSVTHITYSDVRGGWKGPGNVDVDPGFVDPASDWRLAPGAPVIDAADTGATPEDALLDLDGSPRDDDDPCTADTGVSGINRFPVDMGAYEFIPPCPTDLDCDGSTDFDDLVRVVNAYGTCGWCLEDIDGSGDVDFNDLLAVLTNWGPCV